MGVRPLWAQLLYNRGILSPSQAREFLAPDVSQLHDPFLLPGMDRAVERILRAIGAGETIAVYGDFDTDGVTASALLQGALMALGGRVVAYLPHRIREGHGLNLSAIRSLREQGASLLVTVDTGISAVEEVAAALDAGLDTIITDHHAPPTALPDAYAVITPRHALGSYPNPYLTGAGLAFKLAQALYQRRGAPPDDPMLELAALGTVADMAPLQGENRALTWAGLGALRRTQRPGLLALFRRTGLTANALDHEAIPFVVAPRLNAAGRIDSADVSFRLLTCQDPEEAEVLAQALERQNGLRKSLTDEMLGRALLAAQAQAPEERLLLLASEDFAPGINGLVATRLVEAFYRPAVVVSLEGELVRGSGRSIPEFDMAKALTQCSELLLRFGGHPAAAGFTARARDLPALQERLQALAREALGGLTLAPHLRIDAQVSVKELLGETFDFVRSLAPFGQGNPPPLFLTRGVQVLNVRTLGAEGQHLALTLKHGGATWDAIAFRQRWQAATSQTHGRLPIGRDAYLDVVYTLGVDTFRGRGTVQLQVLDFRPAGESATPT
jgi:single-stranded-DNA-specific exonuclease